MTRSPPRPASARIALAIVLVAFVALAVRVAMTLETPPDPLEQKLAGADRFLYYVITPKTGPVFELTGTEGAIRLVTHAVLPAVPGAAYDPSREVEFGVHLELELGGGKSWQRDIYTRSRQSKARRVADHGGMWIDENTFTLDGLELSDDRLVIVPLPADVAVGSLLKVTLLGDPQQGLLRAYTPTPRDDIARRVRDLLPIDRTRLAEQISYIPWDRLTHTNDLTSLRYAERRLSAEGKEGVDYQTRTVYTSGFRLRYATLIERGTLVTPEHGMVVNVVGPAKVDLRITRPIGTDMEGAPEEPPARRRTDPEPPGKLDVKLVGEGPIPPPLAIPLPDTGTSSVTALDIPAGVFTATLVTTSAARVELAGPPTQAVGLGGVAGAPLSPDEQAVPVYLSGPGGPPIAIAINGPHDLLGRVIRIDVRALASTPALDTTQRAIKQWPTGAPTRIAAAPPAPPPPRAGTVVTANLTIEAVDAGGRVVATSTAKIESEVTQFETANLFGKLTASVCEPISVRFVVPPTGTEVRLRTDKPALLQMSTPIEISPPADKLDAPYDAVPLTTLLWRYARYLERGWMTVRPRNHDELMPERVVSLSVQARLEPREVPPAPELNGVSLAPAGRLEVQTVVERVGPEDVAGFVARWDDGHYTRIVPGRRVVLDLSRAPSRPTIQYWATTSDADVVGSTARISIDGQAQDSEVFTAASGAFRLAAGLTGKRALTVDTPAPVRLLIDRPPVGGGAELYALRSVYRIADGRRVRVTVTKRTSAPQNVNIVVYARTPAADPKASVRVTVDGGAPVRIGGVAIAKWTLADRTVPLPVADRPPALGFANVARGGQLHPRLIVIALGDDLPAGAHTVDVSVTGASGVWGRLFTLQEPPIEPRALQWRDATDTSEGSP